MQATGGVDTWSPCWYVDTSSTAARELTAKAVVAAKRGRLLADDVGGHRIGWMASSGLLYAEGHPFGEERGLASPDGLPAALTGLVEAMVEAGVPVPNGMARRGVYNFEVPALDSYDAEPGFAGIRRLDSTVDLRCSSAAVGLAVLAGVAGICTSVPRAQANVRYSKGGGGGVETVELFGYSGRHKLGRWYDKGLESVGRSVRGEMVRAEDQRRFPKGHRRAVEELTSEYVRAKFCDRFLPLWQATKGVTVAGPLVLADRLVELVQEDELSVREAERLAGFVLLSRAGVRQRRTAGQERRKRLRELGLVVAEGGLEEVEVDLHEVMEQALDGSVWGRG